MLGSCGCLVVLGPIVETGVIFGAVAGYSVSGSRREGRLSVHAENLGGQGWAGTWEVTTDAARVLRDGQYVSEGGGTVAHGRFEPDGTPNRAP